MATAAMDIEVPRLGRSRRKNPEDAQFVKVPKALRHKQYKTLLGAAPVRPRVVEPAEDPDQPEPLELVEIEWLTLKELRKWRFVRKLGVTFSGVCERNEFVGLMAQLTEASGKEIGATWLGRTVDETIAPMVGKAHETSTNCINYVTKKVIKPWKEAGTYAFHTSVRYWPPTLSLRLTVDWYLGITTAFLSIMKDILATHIMFKATYIEEKNVKINVIFSQYIPEHDISTDTEHQKDVSTNAGGKTTEAGTASNEQKIPGPATSEDGVDGEAKVEGGAQEETDLNQLATPGPITTEAQVSGGKGGAKDETNESQQTVPGPVPSDAQESGGAQEEINQSQCSVDGVWQCGESPPARSFLEVFILFLYKITQWWCLALLPITASVAVTLNRVSYRLNNWSGLSWADSDEERKEREELFALLVRPRQEDLSKKPKELRGTVPYKRWLFDLVVDRQVGHLLTYPLARAFLTTLKTDLQRPVIIAEKIADKLKKFCSEKNLVHYLQEDPYYNEDEDGDYKPPQDNEVSMDFYEDHSDEDNEEDTSVNETFDDAPGKIAQDNEAPSCSTPFESDGIKGTSKHLLVTKMANVVRSIQVQLPISPLVTPQYVKPPKKMKIEKSLMMTRRDRDRSEQDVKSLFHIQDSLLKQYDGSGIQTGQSAAEVGESSNLKNEAKGDPAEVVGNIGNEGETNVESQTTQNSSHCQSSGGARSNCFLADSRTVDPGTNENKEDVREHTAITNGNHVENGTNVHIEMWEKATESCFQDKETSPEIRENGSSQPDQALIANGNHNGFNDSSNHSDTDSNETSESNGNGINIVHGPFYEQANSDNNEISEAHAVINTNEEIHDTDGYSSNPVDEDDTAHSSGPPGVREFRAVPGAECREFLDADDNRRRSSNVDTGQMADETAEGDVVDENEEEQEVEKENELAQVGHENGEAREADKKDDDEKINEI